MKPIRRKSSSKPSRKTPGRRAEGRPKRTYDDLPWSYGETELVLMPVDPFLIHAYWDFSPEDWKKVQRRRKPVVLRVYDVTMIEFNGANAHSYFDLPIALEAQNWYVRLWSAEKSLCADLGWPLPDGSFETLVRSNVIQTPRAGVSIFEETRWVDTQRARGGGPRRVRSSRSKRRGQISNQKVGTDFKSVPIWGRRNRPVAGPRPAFWPRLEELVAGITNEAAGGLSSRPIGTKTSYKTPA